VIKNILGGGILKKLKLNLNDLKTSKQRIISSRTSIAENISNGISNPVLRTKSQISNFSIKETVHDLIPDTYKTDLT